MKIEDLGFTQEELQNRVINVIAHQAMGMKLDEEDNEHYWSNSLFNKKLQQFIMQHIDESIRKIAEKYVLPHVTEMVENLVLQETNKWGEKIGKPLTFKEYFVFKAESYMTEQVDLSGKSKNEAKDSYWTGRESRIENMVQGNLKHTIEVAMKDVIKTANNALVGGIQETVRIKLNEISNSIKIGVSIK